MQIWLIQNVETEQNRAIYDRVKQVTNPKALTQLVGFRLKPSTNTEINTICAKENLKKQTVLSNACELVAEAYHDIQPLPQDDQSERHARDIERYEAIIEQQRTKELGYLAKIAELEQGKPAQTQDELWTIISDKSKLKNHLFETDTGAIDRVKDVLEIVRTKEHDILSMAEKHYGARWSQAKRQISRDDTPFMAHKKRQS
ncbi:MAG: hypothetical protein OXT70_15415 [Chloroflexota bacterium]|nr:hypothetical protein [Chloroflexota bacterium]